MNFTLETCVAVLRSEGLYVENHRCKYNEAATEGYQLHGKMSLALVTREDKTAARMLQSYATCTKEFYYMSLWTYS